MLWSRDGTSYCLVQKGPAVLQPVSQLREPGGQAQGTRTLKRTSEHTVEKFKL